MKWWMSRQPMEIKIGIFNVWSVKKRLQAVNRLSSETWILGLCERRIKKGDDQTTEALDETIEAPTTTLRGRGYGGVALTINPLLQYKPVHRYSSQTIQIITIIVITTTVTVRYLSPRPLEGEEKQVINKIKQLSGSRAIMMRDLNARNWQWHKKVTPEEIGLNTRHSSQTGTYPPPRSPSTPRRRDRAIQIFF